jgi:hypothetical protein
MNRILQFLVGTRDDVQRGAVSGLISNACLVVLLLPYILLSNRVLLPQFTAPELASLFNTTSARCALGGLLLAFVLYGGTAVGWLFIRPLATFLRYFLPGRDIRLAWVSSSVLVWVLFVGLAFYELLSRNESITFFFLLIFALISGTAGGLAASRATIIVRSDARRTMVLAASITGSAFVFLQLLLSLGLATTTANLLVSSGQDLLGSAFLSFYISLTLMSLIATLPYMFLIWPVGDLLSRFKPLQEKKASLWMSVSGIIWLVIAAAFFATLGEVILSGWPFVLILALSGMLGGWAISQFKDNL